ncbi:MAG: hypothetical protein QM681_19670 [Novosphingobium sp.]
MTARFSHQTRGADGETISTVSRKVASPEQFAAVCKQIVMQHDGHTAHHMLDRLVTDLLSSLGYSEGMAVFLAHVAPFHNSPAVPDGRRPVTAQRGTGHFSPLSAPPSTLPGLFADDTPRHADGPGLSDHVVAHAATANN